MKKGFGKKIVDEEKSNKDERGNLHQKVEGNTRKPYSIVNRR